ncbi:MAG TPA: lytic transglycosylase domain-containing protein [Solirubrobacterales bacterium]|nr:lytic transglycosylase domain-containing protein [Solirubrobacterales bacterium]
MNGVEGVGPSSAGLTAASQAAARVAELQTLISEVETGGKAGKGSFGAALAEATAVEGGASPALGEATALTAPTTSPLPTTGAPSATSPSAYEAGEDTGSVPFAATIEAACAKYGLNPNLLAGLIEQESHFDPTVGSGAGAQGLTELMPETASFLGVTDPHDPTQSIEGGARLLSEKLSEFGGNVELALAAYNAGSGAVQQYDGIPPYPETEQYVQKVLGYASGYEGGGAFAGAAR